ncbi:MAG: hypothetical protein JXB35_00055 [Anaerolineae bacterium]|nr:hypothetical protein [Anaerolineae bacterium]
MKVEIKVQGVLDTAWSELFAGMTFSSSETGDGSPVTMLTGAIADQAALRGLLNRLWDLNLTLISVTCLYGWEDDHDRALHTASGI